MSEYCKQCSEEIFGEDFKELAGLISKEKVDDGYGAVVTCEGCGFVLVDHEGRCIDIYNCIRKHNIPK